MRRATKMPRPYRATPSRRNAVPASGHRATGARAATATDRPRRRPAARHRSAGPESRQPPHRTHVHMRVRGCPGRAPPGSRRTAVVHPRPQVGTPEVSPLPRASPSMRVATVTCVFFHRRWRPRARPCSSRHPRDAGSRGLAAVGVEPGVHQRAVVSSPSSARTAGTLSNAGEARRSAVGVQQRDLEPLVLLGLDGARALGELAEGVERLVPHRRDHPEQRLAALDHDGRLVDAAAPPRPVAPRPGRSPRRRCCGRRPRRRSRGLQRADEEVLVVHRRDRLHGDLEPVRRPGVWGDRQRGEDVRQPRLGIVRHRGQQFRGELGAEAGGLEPGGLPHPRVQGPPVGPVQRRHGLAARARRRARAGRRRRRGARPARRGPAGRPGPRSAARAPAGRGRCGSSSGRRAWPARSPGSRPGSVPGRRTGPGRRPAR